MNWAENGVSLNFLEFLILEFGPCLGWKIAEFGDFEPNEGYNMI